MLRIFNRGYRNRDFLDLGIPTHRLAVYVFMFRKRAQGREAEIWTENTYGLGCPIHSRLFVFCVCSLSFKNEGDVDKAKVRGRNRLAKSSRSTRENQRQQRKQRLGTVSDSIDSGISKRKAAPAVRSAPPCQTICEH